MSLKDSAHDWVKSVVNQHLGSNIRQWQATTYVGGLRHNMYGGVAYLPPLQGTVVDESEQFTLLKLSANKFCVILSALLSEPVAIGSKIAVKFYQLRRFDGSLADGGEDPHVDGCHTFALTGAETFFPVQWEDRYLGINKKFKHTYREIQNPYLRDLITQMEKIPVNGGMRRIVNVLVEPPPNTTKVEVRTFDGERLLGFWRPPAPGMPVVVGFHDIGSAFPIGHRFANGAWGKAGWGMLAVAFRGYPGSTGSPTAEGLIEDGEAARAFVMREAPDAPMVFYGHGFGGAVATRMAELHEESVPNRMLEVEQATMNAEAVARLDALREQLGLPMAQPPVR